MQNQRFRKQSQLRDAYDPYGLYYCCPICHKSIRYVAHPSMGEAWSRGVVRGKHLRSHGIDHHYISPGRKDDPGLIRELYKWNKRKESEAKSKLSHKQIEKSVEEKEKEEESWLTWLQ